MNPQKGASRNSTTLAMLLCTAQSLKHNFSYCVCFGGNCGLSALANLKICDHLIAFVIVS